MFVDRIYLVLDRDLWRAIENTVMNLREFIDQLRVLLVSQEGLWSTELLSYSSL